MMLLCEVIVGEVFIGLCSMDLEVNGATTKG